MSLDVTLYGPAEERACTCSECGNRHTHQQREQLYWANITHNLGPMAQEAGIYKHLWRPEGIGITKAHRLIQPLTEGLALLEKEPRRFQMLDSPNGWGTYEHFVPFVRKYLNACIANPNAAVEADR